MQVTIQLSADLARSILKQAPPTEASKQLSTILDEYQVDLQPVYPGTQDPTLIGDFTVLARDEATAQRLIERLVNSGVVKAAYIQPTFGLPE